MSRRSKSFASAEDAAKIGFRGIQLYRPRLEVFPALSVNTANRVIIPR